MCMEPRCQIKLKIIKLIMSITITMSTSYLNRATNNRQAVQQSTECVCVYCCVKFHPSTIEEWVDDDLTAVCPHCDVDAVVPAPYTDDDIRRWHQEGFGM